MLIIKLNFVKSSLTIVKIKLTYVFIRKTYRDIQGRGNTIIAYLNSMIDDGKVKLDFLKDIKKDPV